MEVTLFKEWLSTNTSYSDAVLSDIASRMKRADNIVTWEPTTIYLFKLEQSDGFKKLNVSVKSKLRRVIKCYVQFIKDKKLEEIGVLDL